jgi:hypothetical protein
VPSVSKTWWSDARLKGAVHQAAAISAQHAGELARVRNPAPSRINVIATFSTITGTGTIRGTGQLAPIFEGGAKPHEIAPKKQALGGPHLSHPLTSEVRHPGIAARPFIRPAGAAWPTLFNADGRAVLGASGFRSLTLH